MTLRHNPFLLDHYVITFQFLLCECLCVGKYFYTRCLSDYTLNLRKWLNQLSNSMPWLMSHNSFANLSPFKIDYVVDGATGSLWMTLDPIVLERLWHKGNDISSKPIHWIKQKSWLVWQYSFKTYRPFAVLEQLFNTVARLTEFHWDPLSCTFP